MRRPILARAASIVDQEFRILAFDFVIPDGFAEAIDNSGKLLMLQASEARDATMARFPSGMTGAATGSTESFDTQH
jgi:hypothetical protein